MRDLIYYHYLHVDGGYTYNFVTNKLVGADNWLISLALTLTCSQVAAEMQGLALALNKITFRTYHSEETNEDAALLHKSLNTAQGAKYRLLDAMAPRYLTADMSELVATRYPRLRPLLEGWRSHPPLSLAEVAMQLPFPKMTWGECPSLWAEFVDFTLKLLSKHPDFPREPERIWWGVWNRFDAARLIDMHLPPAWAIPDSDEAQKLQEDIASTTEIHGYRHPFSRNGFNGPCTYTYSAASVAIRFLNSIPQSTLHRIRNVLLEEDREAIAEAPCHAQGLIPFCRENQNMVIKRNVNLWAACLYVTYKYEGSDIKRAEYTSEYVTLAIGSWFMETLRLPQLGMPPHSFQLTLDAGPLPKLARSVYKAVGHDAIIQAVIDIFYDRGTFGRQSWVQRRLRGNYTWEDLPQVYQDINAGRLSSLIHCNFEINVGPNFEEVADAWEYPTVEKCESRWMKYVPRAFALEAPLPPIRILRSTSLSSHGLGRSLINWTVPRWNFLTLE